MPWPAPLFAADAPHTVFEWGRIQTSADWILPVAACVAMLVLAVVMYRRDAAELHPLARIFLTALRSIAIFGLLLVYLEPQWRIERDVVRNSRVVLLVDTSLSMGLPDQEQTSIAGGPSRTDRVVRALAETDLMPRLRDVHDVAVMRFDQQTGNVVKLDKRSGPTPAGAAGELADGAAIPLDDAAAEPAIDWSQALAARGGETRLGQALRQVLLDERAGPVSGIVVITDGGQNAGPGPAAAVQIARDAGIPIHTVGLGSARQPINVRVGDLLAPARAYPGDDYVVTGYIQGQGMANRLITVELFSRAAEAPGSGGGGSAAASTLEGAQDVLLGADGEAVPVKFEITPGEAGRRTLTLRVQPPADDSNPTDNQQEADVEVVDRKTRILLFASGPTREYRFLHTFLHRDSNVIVDVLLQTAQPGVSQEANEILDTFPATREALDKYDAIVAFDPDWKQLTASEVDHLERWVGEQAGGLIVVPGPIHTQLWMQNEGLAKLRDLYPVEFNRRFSVTDDGRFGAKNPWPLEFTREGLEAEFLWLGDSASASQLAWATFPGVYGYYSVRGAKPGATVYARYSDPRAAAGGEQPVYWAGQFYGSGRTFYLGSGEMWRLRAVNPDYFDEFYTKLLRHVSQGRLLRGSSHGVLLAERDRFVLGQMVALRAQLFDTQLEPLRAASVNLEVYLPDGTLQNVKLTADPTRAGNYSGQFAVRQEGVFRLELPVPDTDAERLTRRIQVRVPDLERENPQRNDPLLTEIARETGGRFYVGMDALMGGTEIPPLAQELRDRSLIIPVSEAPKPLWDNVYVLLGLCGVLAVEWLTRRLLKLA